MMTIRVALVGRPNSGKSSLYNMLTGGDVRVGNFPGTTVDVEEATLRLPDTSAVTLLDLPGVYSLDGELDPSTEEGLTQRFVTHAVADRRVTFWIQAVNATQLAAGLRLTQELQKRHLPFGVLVTQIDVLAAEGGGVDPRALQAELGVPVLALNTHDPAARSTVCAWLAEQLSVTSQESPVEPGWDPVQVAHKVLAPSRQGGSSRTERLDRVLLHPVLGPLLFLAILACLFAAVLGLSEPMTHALEGGLTCLSDSLSIRLGGPWSSFLVHGLLRGAGAVFVFVPQIVTLAMGLELLEASGYLARGAFLVDRSLRPFGLSGRAFFPLLLGHACALPAITATRTIRDPRERLTVLLVLPLMTCSARLPTYALLLGTFFAERSLLFRSLCLVALYCTGILSALVAALALRRSGLRGRVLPLLLELPAYRTPVLSRVLRKGKGTGLRFLQEVGTKMVVASALVWGLLVVPCPGKSSEVHTQNPVAYSLAAKIGHTLEPLTAPLGFDWRINVGLVSALGQRELMVSTLGVLFGLESHEEGASLLAEQLRAAKKSDGSPAYSVRTGLSLLAFFVLACQCVSTLVALRGATHTWKWPLFVFLYTYLLAYVAAWGVYRLSGFFVVA